MKRILSCLGICALFFHTACSTKGKEVHETEHTLLVTSPIIMDTSITQEYVCQIHSIQHIELKAQERGYLEKIYVDEGQFVKKGQLLFKIMPRLYEAELHKAQAEVNFADIEYQNTKSLAERNVVASNELAMAKAKYDKALAELELAEVHLQFTEIRAPFSGIIDRFHVREGSLVEEGELLSKLSDNSNMWVYYNVPEAKYLDYQEEVNEEDTVVVQLMMANNKLFKHTGIVETIEGEFNHETGNIAFRASFPNPKSLLRHGETGNILLTIPLEQATIIPQKATFEVLDKRYVYVVDENDVIRSREIHIAQEIPHLFVVEEGLNTNDKILLEGLRLVRENDKINYDFIEPKTALIGLDLYAE